MQFKTKEVREQALSGRLCVSLRDLIGLIDRFAILCGVPDPNGITLTNVWSDYGYHELWKAVDIRTKDWPIEFRHQVRQILTTLRSYNPCIQHEFEPNPNNPRTANNPPHLHIEYDDGSLHRGENV